MGDRFDGALAGGDRSMDPEIGVAEALQQLALNETLVTSDVSGDITIFRVVQNPYCGGVLVTQESGATSSSAMTEAIKLSQMTSMLKDDDRCSKYAEAIARAIQKLPDCRVLDIGTGTGLLAMLAARAGARHVDAVELFQPLADLASRVIKDNRLENRVSVHIGGSTEFAVRADDALVQEKVLPERADILVTEVFDSALLGENCLDTMAHAHNELLKDNAIVIPAKAVIYGAVLHSDFCLKFQNLGSSFSLHRSERAQKCCGGAQGLPLHLEALEEGKDYEYLTEKFEVFTFDFGARDLDKCFERKRSVSVPRIRNGTPNAIVVWWELDLLGTGEIIYSTKPGVENWQDHWLTVFYPLLADVPPATDDQSIPISMRHDRMSFSFTYGMTASPPNICTCGYHILPGGPYRIFELGDEKRMASLQSRITSAIERACVCSASTEDSKITTPLRCIDISDSGVCALLASKVATERIVEIFSIEEDNEFSALLYNQVAKHQATDKSHDVEIVYKSLSAFVEQEQALRRQIPTLRGLDVVLSEPFTRAMCAYPLSTLCNLIIQRNALADLLSPTCVIVPGLARVKAQAIRFPADTMQRSFGAVHEVQGLDHACFAALYDDWPSKQRISLPLFQYRPIAASEETILHEYDLCAFEPENVTKMTDVALETGGSEMSDAVRIWVEYDGDAPTRVARSEVMWFGEETRAAIMRGKHVRVRSGFVAEDGLFDVTLSAGE